MLKEVAEKLKKSDRPVMQNIHSDHGTKIIAVGLKKGVELAAHTAPSKAKLILIKGRVRFNINDKNLYFDTLDTYDIPIKVSHSVIAEEDAIFLLVLS